MSTARHKEGMGKVRDSNAAGLTTILLVEESEIERFIISEFLDPARYSILETGNVFYALSLCEGQKKGVDLILMNMEMCRLDGLNFLLVLQCLRPDIPILGMTESPEIYFEEPRLKNIWAGFVGTPLTPHRLESSIRTLLSMEDAPRTGVPSTMTRKSASRTPSNLLKSEVGGPVSDEP